MVLDRKESNMKHGVVCFCLLAIVGVSSSFADIGIDSLLSRLAADVEKDKPFETAFSTDSVREMDSKWHIKSETVIERRIIRQDSTMDSELVRAVRFEKGETKDITAEMAAEEQKNREKEKSKKRSKQLSFSLGSEELFPFSMERRRKFDFSMKDSVVEGKAVMLLSADPKKNGEKLFHSRYLIEPDSLRVLSVDLIPSEFPTFVKEMEMQLDFVPGLQNRVLQRMAMRVYANAIIKKIRMEVVTTFHDFTF
jgi:hypothetical protein